MSYVGGEVENIQSKILEDLLQTEIGELFEYDLIKELISLAKYELAVVSLNRILYFTAQAAALQQRCCNQFNCNQPYRISLMNSDMVVFNF